MPQGTTGAVDGDQYWERFMPALIAALCDDHVDDVDDDDVYGHDSVLLVLIIPHAQSQFNHCCQQEKAWAAQAAQLLVPCLLDAAAAVQPARFVYFV